MLKVVHTLPFRCTILKISLTCQIITSNTSGPDPAGRLLPGPHPPRGGGRGGAAALWPGRHQARPPELGQGPATQVNNKYFCWTLLFFNQSYIVIVMQVKVQDF